MRLKEIKKRGQVMVLWAVLTPLLIVFIGAGMDLGWYYLNVSRLQNAADAAVVAGARALVKDNDDFKDYTYDGTIVGTYIENLDESRYTTKGDVAAKEYAVKNLGETEGDSILDNWSKGGDPKVTMETELHEDDGKYYYVVKLTESIEHFFLPGWFDDMSAPVVAVAVLSATTGDDPGDPPDNNGGGENDPSEPLELIFKANGGSYDNGKNSSTTTLDKTLDQIMSDKDTLTLTPQAGEPTREGYTFRSWNTKADGSGKSYTKDQILSAENTKILFETYGSGNTVTLYAQWKRNEDNPPSSSDPEEPEIKPLHTRTLWEQMQYLIAKNVYDQSWDISVAKYGSKTLIHNSFRNCSKAQLNSYHYYTEQINMNEYDELQYYPTPTYRKIGESDHYFLDFLKNNTINGGNTNIGIPKYGFTYDYSVPNNKYRTHSLVNVNTLYATRAGYNDDPLYCNFEGEPYVGDETPIRQIVININVDNTDDKYRPLFFYYDGSDARKAKKDRVSILRPDLAQPVILNLNANFKGVLWMPEVPVVINGNGHTFEGFIVAKEFRYLSTSGTQVKYSIDGKTDKAYSNNKIYIDGNNGNVNSTPVDATTALDLYANRANFGLSDNSKFRKFKAETDVKYTYVFYDNNLTIDPTPFYDVNGNLLTIYRKNAAGETVLAKTWDEVVLYDENGSVIPKTITGNDKIRTVRLGDDGKPKPVYDAAGNPIYFCEDYVNAGYQYDIFTLQNFDKGDPTEKEFLLIKTDTLNVSNTDEWR